MRFDVSDEEMATDAERDRRAMMRRRGVGIAGAAALAAIGLAGSGSPAQATNNNNTTFGEPAGPPDADILTFALNLEYLEAEFYLFAATGSGLAASDRTGAGQGTVTGGAAVPFRSGAIQQYAQRIAVDEQAHVKFLRAALTAAGVTPIGEPNINLTQSFTTLAIAAGLIVQGQTFNPFADDISFLLGASIFEDVGVTAYAGAARYIGTPDYLEAAAGILAVEAYHSGAIRTLLANIGAGVAFGKISALRATLSGKPDDQGILIPGNNYNIVPNDINALAFRRSTSQVLNIVYGNTTATPGLFFPNGLNGNIK